jgi:GNAT superfamily N-acetyltransferase
LGDAEVVFLLAREYPLEAGWPYSSYVSDADKALFVAEENDQIIGFAGVVLEHPNRSARIDQVFVHPRYRRWGIGTHLIAFCTEYAASAGARAVLAYAPVSSPGWTVYLKAGFRISGFTNDYYAPRVEAPQAALLLVWDAAADASP